MLSFLRGIKKMASLAIRTKLSSPPCDPFSRVANTIGGLILAEPRAKQSSSAIARKVTHAMHAFFDAKDAQGRKARVLLMRHLIEIEAQEAKLEAADVPSASDFISTTEAAKILGFSRPYVVMLIDQGQIPGAILSTGGHRRVSMAAILALQQKHSKDQDAPSIRKDGQQTGAYDTPEATVVRRIKALSKKKR